MKLTYLGQTWNYKPEYDIADFVRCNHIEQYDPFKVVKLMKKLYPIWMLEQRPEYDEVLDPNPNRDEKY